jgi:caffeoyl-CoA O-methyltransferase
MLFTSSPEEAYAAAHTSPLSAFQQQVLAHTLATHPKYHMISGAVQGQFLRLFSLALQPRRILEIGTFTGFSALCLADGLPTDGLLYTLECRTQDAQTAAHFFAQCPKASQLKLLVGDAHSLLPQLDERWDLVFLDADKTGYIDYYEAVLPRLRPGGFVLADNVLFHGEVVAPKPKSKHAKALHAFNQHLLADPRIDTMLLTLRDGISIIRKR